MKERSCRRAEEEREAEEDDEQVAIVGDMLHLLSQGHHRASQVGRGSNVDRCKHSRSKNLFEDYFIPNSLYSTVNFRGRYRMQPHFRIFGSSRITFSILALSKKLTVRWDKTLIVAMNEKP
ncbi:hypothetical protein L3X38_009543 [Prunus dulcis]|uniref:Uncharacterized protein n=1 Tax=Prunus dulcis TaxID=3755 RepID=A0AAD4WER9_PRUDU|nr:hypothetical protein L3X38_009543 [Prunus dulcis]